MKKFTLIICTAFLALALNGCSSKNSPRATAENFCKAFFVDDDFEKALQFTTGDARQQLASVIAFRNEVGAQVASEYFEEGTYPEIKFHIENVDKKDDRAFVRVKLSPKKTDIANFDIEEVLELVKIDGKWFVTEF